jgi:6-phosphogluconolactonase
MAQRAGRDVELIVADDIEGAAQIVAERLAWAAGEGLEIALTGGSTPGHAYELAAGLRRDWSEAGVWWGDERCVPPDDDRSNFGLARKTLLDRLEAPPRAVHRIRGEAAPDEAAREYEEELRGVTLDLVLLGLGPDAHVASLFPNEPSLQERERLTIPTEPKLEPFVPRVSLTVPVLRGGRSVLFFVTGESKADAAARAFAGPPDPAAPGSLIRSDEGETVAVLDAAAADKL